MMLRSRTHYSAATLFGGVIDWYREPRFSHVIRFNIIREAAPASPDNVPGPEEPEQAPPSSDHVIVGPVYSVTYDQIPEEDSEDGFSSISS
ncbi:hypothetical protein Tco_0065023 [Tanacetum coccineum]